MRRFMANTIQHPMIAMKYDASHELNVHVRLGDFSPTNKSALEKGQNNTRIRIEWYVAMVNKVRQAAGWRVPVNVFSDGTDEELQKLLSMLYTVAEHIF